MGLYGSSAPDPDPQIGEAAKLSAQIGEDYLEFMQGQADIANQWAEDDRAYYETTYKPLQEQYIAEAQEGPDYSGVASAVQQAGADATRQFSLAQGQEDRRLASMGVNPASGRSTETARRSELTEALGTAGIKNTTRTQQTAVAEAEAEAKLANAINMGSGMAVNPATSLGLANGAMSSGANGAMSGYGQQGQLLNTQYQQQMQSWNANNSAAASTMSGIGSMLGLGVSMLSSKKAKTNKKPVTGVLDAVREMPVEQWDYKQGMGDEGRHIGTYAEDFKAKTGLGDGKTINLGDAIGITMKSVQELADKVDTLEKGQGAKGRAAPPKKPVRSGVLEVPQ